MFSSSATVYGDPASSPIPEGAPLSGVNPYGRTKLAVEDICRDLARSEPGWHIALLRYFNPVGAHPSGLIGEDPRGIPNNLMPYVLQVAAGRRPYVRVFGRDYPTPDGTGVRDYIHVVDLAVGHVAALRELGRIEGCLAINLGTGQGHSVLEVISSASEAVGRDIPCQIIARRPGDAACCYADPALAAKFLGWKAARGLAEMCVDGWRWQSRNPDGYGVETTAGWPHSSLRTPAAPARPAPAGPSAPEASESRGTPSGRPLPWPARACPSGNACPRAPPGWISSGRPEKCGEGETMSLKSLRSPG